MSRERKDFKRKTGIRDARLFVIATEGEKTEKCYFDTLISSDYFYNPRVHVEVLPSINGKSSPKDVMGLLDQFRKEYRIREDDELWLIIDRDKQSWTIRQIREVAQFCVQKKYELGLSNPCFEFWILLHLTDLSIYSKPQLNELLENKKINKNRTILEGEIIKMNGSYNKSNPDFESIMEHVPKAIYRAKQLDQKPAIRWIDHLGTKVHLLVEKII